MRIGFDVTAMEVGPQNGTPIYMHHLLSALLDVARDARFVLVSNTPRAHPVGDRVADVLDRARGRAVLVRAHLRSAGVPAHCWWFDPFPPGIRKVAGELDVFHAGESVWPRHDGTPTVVSVLDLTTVLFPHYHTLANRLRHRLKLRWIRAHADRVITISQASRRDLLAYGAARADNVDVIPLARGHSVATGSSSADVGSVLAKYALEGAKYVLCVATIEPRKNHLRLIQAFERLPAELASTKLVLVGAHGWRTGDVLRALETSPARDRIVRPGFVPAAELAALYAGATAFAYPSLYEGFGMPVLEAMAAGVPVLTSTSSSLPEVAGEAALLVEPTSVEAIRGALERLLVDSDLRARLAERGRERERGFTWRRTAEQTLATYRAAIAARSAAPRRPTSTSGAGAYRG